jgi:hypothetical protein
LGRFDKDERRADAEGRLRIVGGPVDVCECRTLCYCINHIRDILGQMVVNKIIKTENERFSIQLPNELKSGIYIVNIELNNSTITKKIILQ